jgi:hypothetical protein
MECAALSLFILCKIVGGALACGASFHRVITMLISAQIHRAAHSQSAAGEIGVTSCVYGGALQMTRLSLFEFF